MQTMLVTITAFEGGEAVAECQADIDLETFESTDLTDQSFINASVSTYDGFSINIDDKYYAVSVDYFDTANEFMLMDGDGIDAILKYAKDHPTEVEGEVDDIPDENFDDEAFDN
jgi:hypothetical protein